jgi:hypothetical protein
VFVFDGPAPALKRKTLRQRRAIREDAAGSLKSAAAKLLLTQLKLAALHDPSVLGVESSVAPAAAPHQSSSASSSGFIPPARSVAQVPRAAAAAEPGDDAAGHDAQELHTGATFLIGDDEDDDDGGFLRDDEAHPATTSAVGNSRAAAVTRATGTGGRRVSAAEKQRQVLLSQLREKMHSSQTRPSAEQVCKESVLFNTEFHEIHYK